MHVAAAVRKGLPIIKQVRLCVEHNTRTLTVLPAPLQCEWHERKGEGNGLLGLGLKPRKEPPRELGLDTTLAGTTAAGQAGPVAPGEWDAPVGGEWEDGQDDVAAAFAAAGVRPHRVRHPVP